MRAALAIALALLPGCVFYVDGDGQAAPPDAFGVPFPDAGFSPDAEIGDGPCDFALPCPVADVNKVTVCGRISDVETGARIDGASVDVTAYDALDFAGSPTTSAPLLYEEKIVDACGRYRLHNIDRPALGFLAIAVDDSPGADVHATSASAFSVSSGETRSRQHLHAIRHTTDAQWTSQAGLVGASFVERGVILSIFLDETGEPVAGVTITESGSPEPANDYYFAGSNPWTRTTVDPAMAVTGPNGSALKVESSLVEHSGENNCVGAWDSGLAASIPDVLFVAVRHCFLGP